MTAWGSRGSRQRAGRREEDAATPELFTWPAAQAGKGKRAAPVLTVKKRRACVYTRVYSIRLKSRIRIL